jgi:hypothetical protein
MNKIFLLIAALAITSKVAFSQTISASAIKHSSYLQDPKKYTSKIDTNKIKSKILIDRSLYSSLLLNVNGTSKVTAISSGEWASIYENLRRSCSDSASFPDPKKIETTGIEMKKKNSAYPLAIINVDAKRIKESAIINSEFSQEADFLKDIKATTNSFENIRVFAGTSIFSNIFGDDIKFILPSNFIFSNTKDLISKIEIDFGNGLGFQNVNKDEIISVHYPNTNNEFIEIKIKQIINKGNNTFVPLYTHFTVFRKSASTFKTNSNNVNTLAQERNDIFKYYPSADDQKIEYNLLMNPTNKNKKLRRPFIMCDGFDHGNRRNYYKTDISFLASFAIAKEDNDTRGMYELLDGEPSPWSNVNEKHPHFIDSLLKYGYDIVFVNFIDGSGDILDNAKNFRGFLNDVINKNLRDSLTEENTIVGPSMGGVITRIALKQMEKAGEDHFVKIWISFDSPQKGANIPISLQHNINYGSGFLLYGDFFSKKLETINSPAAKQLLKHHYTESSGISHAANEHLQLLNYLDTLGYPTLSKNFGITNGGKQTLYSTPGIQMIKFSLPSNSTYLKGWGQNNANGTFTIAISNGKIYGEETVKSEAQLPLDNAPGGWHSSPNSINFCLINGDKNNLNKDNINNIWACFIPTTSAMGYEINGNSIYSTWQNFTTCNDNTSGKIKTPFDEIHGMETNEEHTKISAQTSEYVIDEFQEYMTSTVRPVVRSGKPINQIIKGKVAYLVIDSIQMGNTGNGNTITLANTADINIRSGNKIKFKTGFKAVAGSKMNAKIVTLTATPYYTTAGGYKSASGVNANSYDPSPFVGKVYDYSEKENTPKAVEDNISLNVFPNPTERMVNIAIDGLNGNQSTLEIYDALGNTVFTQIISSNGTYQLDSSFLQSGVYFIKVKSNNSEAYQRLVKL